MTFCSCCKHCHFSKLLALHTIVCNNKILKNVHMLPSKKKNLWNCSWWKEIKSACYYFFWQNISICCFCPKFYILSSDFRVANYAPIIVLSFVDVVQTLIDIHIYRQMFNFQKSKQKFTLQLGNRLETLAGFAKACYTTLRMGG